MLWLVLALVVLAFWLKHILDNVVLPKLRNNPPVVTGLVPFIGAAIEFGKGPPVNFLKKCQEKHGSIFTLHVAGRKMTFLMDPSLFPIFFHKDENLVDFQFATQPFLSKGFGVSKNDYHDYHEKMLSAVRSGLNPFNIEESQYASRLSKLINEYIDNEIPENGQIHLQKTLREMIFFSSTRCLFGEDQWDDKILQTFENFDSWFEIASSDIPHALLSTFRSAKRDLLVFLHKLQLAHSSAADEPPTMLHSLRENVGDSSLHNWLLGLLWASEANTIPASFWLICHLLEDQKVLRDVEEEVKSLFRENETITFKSLQNMKTLKNSVKESIRLYSPPIILRGVRQDINVGKFVVPKDNFLCLSPFWSHRDPVLYENPTEWKPSRFDTEVKPVFDHSYLSFGDGKYRCPGQFFAYFELGLVLSLFLSRCELSFVDGSAGVPEIERRNLVGVLKPSHDIIVNVRKRDLSSS